MQEVNKYKNTDKIMHLIARYTNHASVLNRDIPFVPPLRSNFACGFVSSLSTISLD